MVKAAAIQKVATFNDFNEDNDPYGEHDFGSFRLCGRRFFCEDPSDPEQTARVLTIMLASSGVYT